MVTKCPTRPDAGRGPSGVLDFRVLRPGADVIVQPYVRAGGFYRNEIGVGRRIALQGVFDPRLHIGRVDQHGDGDLVGDDLTPRSERTVR